MIKAKLEELDVWERLSCPNKYRRTGIETKEGVRYCSIPIDDVVQLAELYERTPHEGLSLSPEGFVLRLSWRFYTEWCLEDILKRETDPDYKGKNHCWDYFGQGFVDFVRDETYYASERAVKSGLIQTPADSKTGDEIRTKVLEAVVKRAVELFTAWSEVNPPYRREEDSTGRANYIYEDERNLRCDLREYIGF
jgi:hypothetical protein